MSANLRVTEERAEELFKQLQASSAGQSTLTASLPSNKNLNRWHDVLAVDATRVVLRGLVDTDYINANYVETADRCYILTQGPLEETVSHFWTMVWQQQSSAIVMLCRTVEEERCKCAYYWPSVDEATMDFDESGLQVRRLNAVYDHSADALIRTFKVKHVLTEQSRKVTQYHFQTWPDFGVPKEPRPFLSFLNLIARNHPSVSESPSIVHCSAGIGRSGTFVLVDSCLARMSRTKVPMTVEQVMRLLMGMRRQRMNLVQTPTQLWFSFLALSEGAKAIDFGSKAEVNVFAVNSCSSPVNSPQKSPTNGLSTTPTSDQQTVCNAGIENGVAADSNSSPKADHFSRKRSTDHGAEANALTEQNGNSASVDHVEAPGLAKAAGVKSVAKRKRDG